MASNVLLQDLIRDFRAEVGHSLVPAQGVNTEEAISYLLGRIQRQLWVEYDWPVKSGMRHVLVPAQTQYVDYPADMSFEGITMVFVKRADRWIRLEHGIHPDDYNLKIARTWKWGNHADTNQMELWPVAQDPIELLLQGMFECPRLTLVTDRCALDGTLIVLRAAAEMAARQKLPDAKIKMDDAARFAVKLLAKQRGGKDKPIIYGGGVDPTLTSGRTPRPGFDYIPS